MRALIGLFSIGGLLCLNNHSTQFMFSDRDPPIFRATMSKERFQYLTLKLKGRQTIKLIVLLLIWNFLSTSTKCPFSDYFSHYTGCVTKYVSSKYASQVWLFIPKYKCY